MHDAPSTLRGTGAIALLAALLWVVQLAGGWEPPIRAGDFVQHDDLSLSHVIDSNRGGGQAEVPERPSDPEELVSVVAALVPVGARHIAVGLANATFRVGQAYTLPVIRAPPYPFFSL